MSQSFREYVQRVGSGQHTSKSLTRAEARTAARLMLLGEATPAQIGAFLIAHRIKRPTPEELAGFLDAYDELGGALPGLPLTRPLQIFGHPYDGRTRTAPVGPLVALILATVGSPVLMHGSGCCPTKYGIPLVELWRALDIDWQALSITTLADILQTTGLGFFYLPDHFPLAQRLMTYREEIGKRPPLATLELLWAPYRGPCQVIAGFVHPPTELMMQETLSLRTQPPLITIKGLEGSCDLPRDRPAIMSVRGERLIVKARDYDLGGPEVPWIDLASWQRDALAVLQGKENLLTPAVVWNAGFYLWQTGHSDDLSEGIQQAQDLLRTRTVAATGQRLATQIAAQRLHSV